jgi:hypothetical protein
MELKIKIIASCPAERQDGIEHLIGKEYEIVPYKEFDTDTRKEMKELGEVAIIHDGDQYIINKNEYEIIE